MGSESFPRQIAGLITEDPDDVKEGPADSDPNTTSPTAKKKHSWNHEFQYEFEELEDATILGDLMYGGMMNVGAEFTEGEAMVMYDRDGGGYPGSPSYWEWEIVDVSEVWAVDQEGQETEVELTDELKKKLIDALHKHESDDTMQERLSDEGYDEPEDTRGDEMRDRMKDEFAAPADRHYYGDDYGDDW